MKINLGSGYKRYPGFLNVDHDPLTQPDFLADLEDLHLPIEDSSVEYIIAHHVLEHVGAGFFSLMKELYRISKHDAILEIKVPHHRSEVFFSDPTHVRPITVDSMKLFSKSYNEEHIKLYNSSSGFGIKCDVDFDIVEYRFNPYPKWQERFESLKNEQIEEIVMDYNNVFHETIIIMKVIK
jgi:ubiquinone/menaquinone biosynthesis C-methylase UbiE